MDHLVCFMPGALALGAHTDPRGKDSPRAKRDLAVAKALMYTCYQMYARMRTGLAPEFVRFSPGGAMQIGAAHNLLRPEAIESIFYMWRFTKDTKYAANGLRWP
jgi:mannosyl-oligosaccharide alpha-1,2-mannosidase